MSEIRRVRLDRSGRFILPSGIRKKLGLSEGDLLTVTVHDTHLTYLRWEGSDAELDALNRADRTASVIEESEPSVREHLDARLSERYGIATDKSRSDGD